MSAAEKEPGFSAYAGRWIARLWGRVVGQGGTPGQALHAAQSTRHKEIPEVSFVPTPSPLSFPPLVDQVRQALPDPITVYLVGGAVRDAFLGKPSQDLDFAVAKDALKLARKIANLLGGAYYRMDDENETGRVILTGAGGERSILDFAVFRGADLEADLAGRDFTINAMAVDIRAPQELLDPLGGVADLAQKIIRACGPASLSDDPVRVLRAVRFAAGMKFIIQPETRQLAKQAASKLPQVSPERLRDELFKILSVPQAAVSMRALDILGALAEVLPELPPLKQVQPPPPHLEDVWAHSLHVAGNLERLLALLDLGYAHNNEDGGDLVTGLVSLKLGRYRPQLSEHFSQKLNFDRSYRPLFMLAALYHDSGRIQEEESFDAHARRGAEIMRKRADALRLSNPETERAVNIVRYHQLPRALIHGGGQIDDLAVYRYFRETGPAGVDIALLSLADLLARHGPGLSADVLGEHIGLVRSLWEAYWEHPEKVDPPALLDGNDLMRALKLKPGKQIGAMLEAVREAQVTGAVADKEGAIELARGMAR